MSELHGGNQQMEQTPGVPNDTYITPLNREAKDELSIEDMACEVACLSNILHACEGLDVSQEALSLELGRKSGEALDGTEGAYFKFLLNRGYLLKDVAMPSPITNELHDFSNYPNYSLTVGSSSLEENILQLLRDGYIVDVFKNCEDSGGMYHDVLVIGALQREFNDGTSQTYLKVYDPAPEFGEATIFDTFDFVLADPAIENQVITGIRLPEA